MCRITRSLLLGISILTVALILPSQPVIADYKVVVGNQTNGQIFNVATSISSGATSVVPLSAAFPLNNVIPGRVARNSANHLTFCNSVFSTSTTYLYTFDLNSGSMLSSPTIPSCTNGLFYTSAGTLMGFWGGLNNTIVLGTIDTQNGTITPPLGGIYTGQIQLPPNTQWSSFYSFDELHDSLYFNYINPSTLAGGILKYDLNGGTLTTVAILPAGYNFRNYVIDHSTESVIGIGNLPNSATQIIAGLVPQLAGGYQIFPLAAWNVILPNYLMTYNQNNYHYSQVHLQYPSGEFILEFDLPALLTGTAVIPFKTWLTPQFFFPGVGSIKILVQD